MATKVDEEWGPSVSGRGRRRRRPLRALGLILLVVLMLLIVAVLWASSQLTRIEVDGLASSGSPMHVLVVGSDTRAELSEEERRELSTGSTEGERTDTIFVMTVRGGETALLAFPRDLMVRRCDGSEGRINVAEQIGGPECLVRTVRELSGIPVQHYVRVTFGGFRDVVDAVDGVELCLEDPIADRDAGIDLPAGCQVLDGADALGYVRVRKIDDDFGRIERQQRFMHALAREVATPATLLNPFRAVPLVNEVGDAVAVDDGMGVLSLARLARGFRGVAGGGALTYTVPVDPGTTSAGAQVLYLRQQEAAGLFARFADGSVLDEAETGVRPEDVRVRVLNGAGVDGLATRVGDHLEARGYQVVEVGNADRRDTTVIQHPPDQRPHADLVASDIPTSVEVVSSTDVTTVTLVLGRDAAGLANN